MYSLNANGNYGMPQRKMDTASDAKLISLISNRSELYDRSNEHFKDTERKERVWREICEEIQVNVEHVEWVKKRWKNLRDTYLKKKKESVKIEGEGKSVAKEWKHYKSMGFLDPFISYLPKVTGIYTVAFDGDTIDLQCTEEDEQESTSDAASTKESLPPSTVTTISTPVNTQKPATLTVSANSFLGMKRKMSNTSSEQYFEHLKGKKMYKQPEKTTEEHFALSLVPALQRMSHQQNGLARIRIQQILYDIEFGSGDG